MKPAKGFRGKLRISTPSATIAAMSNSDHCLIGKRCFRVLMGPSLAVVLAGSLSTGCGQRKPGSGETGPPRGDTDTSFQMRTVETFVSPLEVRAGQSVQASCVVSEGREYRPDEATEILVSPEPTRVTEEDQGVSIELTQVQSYRVQCQTADGAFIDAEGVTVDVVPAEPAVVETVLEVGSTQAGAPVEVECTVFDVYGNEIDRLSYQEPLQLNLPPELSMDPPAGGGFIVRGTVAGDYEVGCTYGALVDETPELLSVVPGIPGNTETTVSVNSVTPTETVDITCTVTDDYGNELAGVPTLIFVTPGSDTPQVPGVSQNDHSFSATGTGTYYVSCAVEGYYAGDESPAVVVVEPGLPFSWVAELPEQDCYWQDRGLPLLYMVYDEWGNEIETDGTGDNSVAVTASIPDGAFIDDLGILRTSGEGVWDITIDVLGPKAPNHEIEPLFVSFVVDSTPPNITIDSPVRSSQIQLGSTLDTLVNIVGSVNDTVSNITTFHLNDSPMSVSGTSTNVPISTVHSSRWGVNVITGEAVDECGNRRVVAQSYIRSGAYFSAGCGSSFCYPSAGARVPRGVLGRLNQPVIDDNDTVNDDIASIGQLILDSQDFNDLLAPGQALASDSLRSTGSCSFCDWWVDTGYSVRRDDNANRQIQWDGPAINYLRAVDGGIAFDIDLEYLDFPLEAQGCARECACGIDATQCLGYYSGWAGVERYGSEPGARARGTLYASLSNGQPEVSISFAGGGIEIGRPYLDLDCNFSILGISFDFVCDAITSRVIPFLESVIEWGVERLVTTRLPPLIEDFLGGFQLSTGFSIPEPVNMTLNISSGMDYIDFDGPSGSGNGELGLYAQVYPSKRDSNLSGSTRGSVRKNGSGPYFDSNLYEFGFGLKDDLLNQVLWAVWYGGGLNLSLSEILQVVGSSVDLSGVSMSLEATEPPVIMPGTDGWQVDIGLGDAKVEATVNLAELLGADASGVPPINVELYLTAIMGAQLDLDPTTNEIQVVLESEPNIYVEVTHIDDEGYQAVMTDLFSAVLELLVPELLKDVLASFPLPAFDLSGLAGLPVGTTLELYNGDIARPNTSNYCRSGPGQARPTHFCLTGSLQ